jgi:dihydroxyacetone kinase
MTANASDAGDGVGLLRPFYEDCVVDAEALIEAAEVQGLDQELALLRAKLLEARGEDVELLMKGVRLVAQIVAARHRMSPARTEEFADAATSTLRSIADQLYPELIPDA